MVIPGKFNFNISLVDRSKIRFRSGNGYDFGLNVGFFLDEFVRNIIIPVYFIFNFNDFVNIFVKLHRYGRGRNIHYFKIFSAVVVCSQFKLINSCAGNSRKRRRNGNILCRNTADYGTLTADGNVNGIFRTLYGRKSQFAKNSRMYVYINSDSGNYGLACRTEKKRNHKPKHEGKQKRYRKNNSFIFKEFTCHFSSAPPFPKILEVTGSFFSGTRSSSRRFFKKDGVRSR